MYSSPWFSAIYLLLFVSLVGCLVPRLRHHLRNLIGSPPPAPARLDRLPHTVVPDVGAAPAEAARPTCGPKLRKGRWRVVRRGDAVTVSAEKGYVKETGNLVFHFALLALLIGAGRRAPGTAGTATGSWSPAPTPASATRCPSTTSTGWAPGPPGPTCRRSA